MDPLLNPVEGWFVNVALARAARSLVALIVAFLMANVSGHYGIALDQAQVTASLFLLIETARHWIANKVPALSWLAVFALVLFAAPGARAQTAPAPAPQATVTLPLGTVDVSNFLRSAQFAYLYDQHGHQLAGGYVPLRTFHTASGTEIVTIGGGVCYEIAGDQKGQGGPCLMPFLRLDNILSRIDTNAWMRAHSTPNVVLPSIRLGGFGGYIYKIGWEYGLAASVGFGGS